MEADWLLLVLRLRRRGSHSGDIRLLLRGDESRVDIGYFRPGRFKLRAKFFDQRRGFVLVNRRFSFLLLRNSESRLDS